MHSETDVLIVGGGITGVGIARDLSMRGIDCILVEKGYFASGASGRNHGLLHSGARYAVADPEAARECHLENRILRKIAPHCIEETDGLFVSLPEDGRDFADRFLLACQSSEIPAIVLSPDEVLEMEPQINPGLINAVKVPDGAIDPFALVLANAKDAKDHGVRFFLHTRVISVLRENDRVTCVGAKDLLSGEEYTLEARYIINATGAWTNAFLQLAGLQIGMALSKGAMLITNQRFNKRVVNRCRPPSDGDIVVPNETVSILGTTSVRSQDFEDFSVATQDVSLLVKEAAKMMPGIASARLIRAYSGIRPLVQSEAKQDDRAISRGFTLIDHGERDGLKNLITVTGGKLTTYRLMAEKASDLLCRKMGVRVGCSTHLTPLPDPGMPRLQERWTKTIGSPDPATRVLCDCELVETSEIERSLQQGELDDLQDIFRRTRLGKGTCQGGFCLLRLVGLSHRLRIVKGDSIEWMKDFLEERWRGIRPVVGGASLKQEELVESIYKGIFNLSFRAEKEAVRKAQES